MWTFMCQELSRCSLSICQIYLSVTIYKYNKLPQDIKIHQET